MTNPVIDKHGVWYPSQTACAKAHGVNDTQVSYHLNRHGHLNHLGEGIALRGPSATMKPVTIGERSWRSRYELARAIGVDRKTICRWLHPDASPRQHARLKNRLAMLEVAQ